MFVFEKPWVAFLLSSVLIILKTSFFNFGFLQNTTVYAQASPLTTMNPGGNLWFNTWYTSSSTWAVVAKNLLLLREKNLEVLSLRARKKTLTSIIIFTVLIVLLLFSNTPLAKATTLVIYDYKSDDFSTNTRGTLGGGDFYYRGNGAVPPVNFFANNIGQRGLQGPR